MRKLLLFGTPALALAVGFGPKAIALMGRVSPG